MGNTRRRQKPPKPEILKAPKLIVTKASPESKNKRIKRSKGRLSISTSNKDYGGNLELPETISQRKYETTGQFMQRLNRLVAKAKVEANMESRFEMNLGKGQSKQQASSSQQNSNNPTPVPSIKRKHGDKNVDNKTNRNPRKHRRKR